jgi:hypothetical protein
MLRVLQTMLKIVAALAAGAVAIAIIIACIQSLFFGNNTSINTDNRSGALLHNLAVVVPGSVFSGRPHEMAPGDSDVFSASTQMVMPIRVTFDTDGDHHEVSKRVILPPLGAYMIMISIDEHLRVSIKPWILWMCTKRPNQALERTATRFAFTFWMAKTFSPRATLAPGDRRSACSR